MHYYPVIQSQRAPNITPRDDGGQELSFDERIEQAKAATFDGKYKLRDDYQGVDTVNPDVDIMEVTRNLVR